MRIAILPLLIIAAATLTVGCRRGGEPPVAPPPPPPSPADWRADDSATTATDLAAEVVKRSWVNEFRDRTARVPVLRLGAINDRSDREVDVPAFTGELKRALGAHKGIQLADADGGPADYTLTGTIGFSEAGQGAVRYYQFDFRLQDAKGETIGTPFALERAKPASDAAGGQPSGAVPPTR